MFLIERLSFLQRLKCTGIIEKGPPSVSFIERFFYHVLYLECPLSEVLLYIPFIVLYRALLEGLGISDEDLPAQMDFTAWVTITNMGGV